MIFHKRNSITLAALSCFFLLIFYSSLDAYKKPKGIYSILKLIQITQILQKYNKHILQTSPSIQVWEEKGFMKKEI